MVTIGLTQAPENIANVSGPWKASQRRGAGVGAAILDGFASKLSAENSPAWARQYLKTLKAESSDALVLEGLLQIGIRLKAEQHDVAANGLLARLSGADVPAELRSRAQQESNALLGIGNSGMRAEYLLGRFGKDACNARVIVPMLGAGIAGELAGTALLGRLAGSTRASLFSGAFGSRLSAGTLGFLTETSVFTGLSRFLRPGESGALADDLARSGLALGALRLSNVFGKSVGDRMFANASGRSGTIARELAPQAFGYLGLLGAHHAQNYFNLSKASPGATLFLDTFSSLVSMGIGGNLGRRMLGDGFAQFQASLKARAESQAAPSVLKLDNFEAFQPHWALNGMSTGLGVLHSGKNVRNADLNSLISQSSMASLMSSGGGAGAPGGGDGDGDGGGRRSRMARDHEMVLYEDPGQHDSITRVISPSPPPVTNLAIVPGYTIGGKYRIEKLLGEGGFGVVFSGTHLGFGRKVAVKMLKPETASNAEVNDRFLKESKAAASIENEHIIDILDTGYAENGAPYMVMEFLDGKQLFEHIHPIVGNQRINQPLVLPRVLNIGRQLAEGLQAAHNQGIIHRDLKPENIVLLHRPTRPDFVKILDFGIAKHQNSSTKMTETGSFFGTVHYSSPEQLGSSGDVTNRSDIYSYGVLLYEMVSGQLPFDDPAPAKIMTSHIISPVPPLRSLPGTPKDLPEGLESIIMRCLEKDPDDRYANFAEVIADLEAVSLGKMPEAVPIMKERVRKAYVKNFISQNRIKLGIGIGVGVAATMLTSAYLIFSPALNSQPQPEASVQVEPVVPTSQSTAPNASASGPTPIAAKVGVSLKVEPKDAHVFLENKDLGVATGQKFNLDASSPMEIEIRRDGYKTKKLTLTAAMDGQEIRLEKESTRPQYPSVRPSATAPKPKSSSGGKAINPWE